MSHPPTGRAGPPGVSIVPAGRRHGDLEDAKSVVAEHKRLEPAARRRPLGDAATAR